MVRVRNFDIPAAVEKLNRILEMELATVVYYTHYSFMVFGHARIPIQSWFSDGATEALGHAQEAGTMITRLEARPSLKIATLPQTHHNTIDEILTETLAREESGVELYRDLLKSIEGQSVVLEEYARQKIAEESLHVANIRMMLRKTPPQAAK
ncbi:MAG TPA: ferritin-like domain-containing protein [Alphaproteobacteria bacterium]|jgi:bacterioferritin